MASEESGDAAQLTKLRRRLQAKAAGHWHVCDGVLCLGAFVPSPELSPDVSDGFVRATHSVSLARVELGIVKAAATGVTAVSKVDDLDAESGSGYWLRAFGADRSVAVPLANAQGRVTEVVSVAVEPSDRTDEAVEALIRALYDRARWPR
jgi:hypothetical protein